MLGGEYGGYKTVKRDMKEKQGKETLGWKIDEEENPKIYDGLRRRDRNDYTSACPDGIRQKLEVPLRVGDPDLREGSNRYTSSWVKEEVHARNCPRGFKIEGKRHILAACILSEDERDV